MHHPTRFPPRRVTLNRLAPVDSQPFARRPYTRSRPPQSWQVEAGVTPAASADIPESSRADDTVMPTKRFVVLLATLIVLANLLTAVFAPAFTLVTAERTSFASPVPGHISGAWFSGPR